MDIAIFCADVGSVPRGRFGWAGRLRDGSQKTGNRIEGLADEVSSRCTAHPHSRSSKPSRLDRARGYGASFTDPCASQPFALPS